MHPIRPEYRQLSEVEKQQLEQVKSRGIELWDYINGLSASRDLALAKTKVEEAVMWATKHITGPESLHKPTLGTEE